jgi:hypothetical protein
MPLSFPNLSCCMPRAPAVGCVGEIPAHPCRGWPSPRSPVQAWLLASRPPTACPLLHRTAPLACTVAAPPPPLRQREADGALTRPACSPNRHRPAQPPLATVPSARACVPRLFDHHFALGNCTYKEPCLLSESPCRSPSFSPVSCAALVLCLPPLRSIMDSSSHRSPSSLRRSRCTVACQSHSRSRRCHRSSIDAIARCRCAAAEIPFRCADAPPHCHPPPL